MRSAPGHQRLPGEPLRFATPLIIVSLLLALGLLAAGCGGSPSSDTSATTASGTVAPTAATTAAALKDGDLGKAIGALWVEAVQKLNGLVADFPSAAQATDGVTALKEEYIQKLVALGEQRQALDTSGRAKVDAAITAALADAANEEWYKTYMANYDAYGYEGGDVDFVNLIASFNILTQYSNFDLLKQQEPDEAARLGIE